MRVWKLIVVAALAVAVADTVWLGAQRRKLPPMLPPADYLEIQQLYAYYSRDVNSGTQRDASWTYTDDGVWDSGAARIAGKAALREWYRSVPQGMTKNGVRDFMSNLVLVPTAEGARGSIYML